MNLKAIVKGSINEEFYLIKNNEYVGFNRLREIVNNEDKYINLNDDLMGGDFSIYHHYINGENVFNIEFVEV